MKNRCYAPDAHRSCQSGFATVQSRVNIAFDDVGRKHHAKPWFDLARMRAMGVSPQEAKERIRAGFENGTYTIPDKGDISYMLSPIHRAYSAPEESVDLITVSFPHYMPYAPHVPGEQLGNFDPAAGPFALNHGQYDAGPHGYLVFMLPENQIAKIRADQEKLLTELCTIHENWCLEG